MPDSRRTEAGTQEAEIYHQEGVRRKRSKKCANTWMAINGATICGRHTKVVRAFSHEPALDGEAVEI